MEELLGPPSVADPEAHSSDESIVCPDDDEFIIGWDEWAEYEEGFGPKAKWNYDEVYNADNGSIVALASTEGDDKYGFSCIKSFRGESMRAFPSMPCIPHHGEHREKIADNRMHFNAAVARPVGRKEMLGNPEAFASMQKEWKGQRDAGVYDFSIVRAYDDVVREAKRKGVEVQYMARVRGICVEKNHQLPKGDPRRKFKGRGVLLVNQVKNQNWEAAFVQDLGNSPASFEASRWVDFYGCLPGNGVKLADAIQAYIQAVLTGPACWVELPDDAWPAEIPFRTYRRPVVRLVKALYGHPDAGTMWEIHCDKNVRELGFHPVGEEWPSMYYHEELQLLLAIYVDDLKMSGPEKNLAKGWKMLRSRN